jgi:F-type H+-transporting ATPase subunit b
MMPFLVLAEVPPSGPVEEIARKFGVDWVHLGAQTISFCIVCFLLYRFAYRPVLAMLDQRRKQIAEGLASAQKMKADLAAADKQREEILRQANVQADKLIAEARAAAEKLLQRQTQAAGAAAEQILAQARAAAVRDRDRIFVELRRQVGHLVVETTAAVAGKVLSDDDQRRLAEETAKYVSA